MANRSDEYIKKLSDRVSDMAGMKGVTHAKEVLKKAFRQHNKYIGLMSDRNRRKHRTLDNYHRSLDMSPEHREKRHRRAKTTRAWVKTYSSIIASGNTKHIAEMLNRLENSNKITRVYKPSVMITGQYGFYKSLSIAIKEDRVLKPRSKKPVILEYREDISWEKCGRKSYPKIDGRYIRFVGITGTIRTESIFGEKLESAYDRLIPGRKERRQKKAIAEKKKAIADMKKPQKVYKLVALVDGQFQSIYNGRFYKKGETVVDKIGNDKDDFCKNGGTFVYMSISDAEKGVFPDYSVNYDAEKIVISGMVWGKRGTDGNKWAFENFKTIGRV